MLLPSRALSVTLVHLLSKKIKPSPTAKRILPPPMPSLYDIFNTNSSEVSEDLRGSASSCSGYSIKSLSRPTTPMTDKRVRHALDAERSIDNTSMVSSRNLGQDLHSNQFQAVTHSLQLAFHSTIGDKRTVVSTELKRPEMHCGSNSHFQLPLSERNRVEEPLYCSLDTEEITKKNVGNRTKNSSTQINLSPIGINCPPTTEPSCLYQTVTATAHNQADNPGYQVHHSTSATEAEPQYKYSNKELNNLLQGIRSFIQEEQDRLLILQQSQEYK
jgi:hypothetical protein